MSGATSVWRKVTPIKIPWKRWIKTDIRCHRREVSQGSPDAAAKRPPTAFRKSDAEEWVAPCVSNAKGWKVHVNVIIIIIIIITAWLVACRAGLSQSTALFQLRIRVIPSSPPLPLFSLPFPSPSFPFPSFPLPAAKRSSSPSAPQSHFAALCARKTHLVAAFLVLWSALQWVAKWKSIYTEFLGFKIPLKSAALFGRTPRTCLRPALVAWLAWINEEIAEPTTHLQLVACTGFCNVQVQTFTSLPTSFSFFLLFHSLPLFRFHPLHSFLVPVLNPDKWSVERCSSPADPGSPAAKTHFAAFRG